MFGFTKVIREIVAEIGSDVSDPEELHRLIALALDSSVKSIDRSLVRGAARMLEATRKQDQGFVERNKLRWRVGFDLLETLIVISQETGEAFIAKHAKRMVKRQDHKIDVLMRIHARSCLISREVLTLMIHGYADGALTRWRSLHELAVSATFLASKPIKVSEMYMAHQSIEGHKAAEEYQVYCPRLGQIPLTDEEFSELTAIRDSFVQQFGTAFGKPYGWAAIAMGEKHAGFRDLEEQVGLEHLRPYYRMASHSVHGGPHGLRNALGLSDVKSASAAPLAGPSNGGMADPGHLTAISLLQTTTALLGTKLTVDESVSIKIMQRFVDRIGNALIKSHRLKRSPHTKTKGRVYAKRKKE